MKPTGVTYSGPRIDDPQLLTRLPAELVSLLREVNGFILHNGALHVRGASGEPDWHSLRQAWEGELAFHRLYPVVRESDVPFAQDCLGDQFLIRDGHVFRLLAETGELEGAAVDLRDFFADVERDPEEFLSYSPDRPLQPGQLLHIHPPFCVAETEMGYSFRPCPAREVILFHAELARAIADLPDGAQFEIKWTD
ncbi:MAG: SMI1/KNR4 family protein [Planctomycetota bacterium]